MGKKIHMSTESFHTEQGDTKVGLEQKAHNPVSTGEIDDVVAGTRKVLPARCRIDVSRQDGVAVVRFVGSKIHDAT